jgi:hypothetical protein
MLKNGTILFAFGRLERLADNSFVISRSFSKDVPFIITKEKRSEVIENMTSKLNYHRIAYAIGILFGIVIGYKIFQKIRDRNKKGQ